MKTLLLLSALVLACSASRSLAQGPTPGHAGIHRSLDALEAELLTQIDRKEQLTDAVEKRNAEINQLTLERNRAQGPDRDRLNQRIEAHHHQNRAAAVETARIGFASERIRIEIDRLMRFDAHLDEAGKGSGRAPAIRSIRVARRDRKGPVQVPGQGRGFQETTLYEVVFSDGSRQQVETTAFQPQR